jgi:hypothetical protein
MRKREAARVKAGLAVCWRCRRPIRADEPWHLGHDDSGTRWMGAEHARCNLSDAGRKRAAQLYGPSTAHGSAQGAAFRSARPDLYPAGVIRWSRHWGGPFNLACPRCRELGHPCEDAVDGAA